ncbi:1-pyrroline-5-carboxylate dehydrogenase [Putridiphycobacter roseus]|uniref:L-glutamate gamma-semialdehyde dehydrogenase n=1 Tax=Putridiphycobacter roseus TaxID=2219161 RepID=A0A2W1NFS1_9FLAO|nr:L-glutamate gamma-semialdehyde dehydrogenase [Putridiphycobacter roseus]PZE17943.1 1-pyrroline-5-carboxylate dehydrogenase [Putridiphycobacter roseus]
MSNAIYTPPTPVNEPVKGYSKDSSERKELLATYNNMLNQTINVPMYIGDQLVETNNKVKMSPPHDHQHILGEFNMGTKQHVNDAIDAALAAREKWASLAWEQRAAIFLRAADLLAGPFRAKMNAATMLAQSKNVMQAEIDAACELIDFFRFNVAYMHQIYKDQPGSNPSMWNRLEYRPLEGFVFAISPFNFTSICANLCAAPAMMGNVVVWKPAESQVYSAKVIMELFKEAGLPDGVINMVTVDGPDAGDVVFKHPDFAALHFTGSTGVFQHLWKEIGTNLSTYKTYPRIVGETGGKDFIIAHKSANVADVATGISRGAFEFQGQKCSAASRAYIPSNKSEAILALVKEQVSSFKMGSPGDTSNFVNAVIDERAFDKIAGFIDYVKESKDATFLIGGGYDKSKGYFIEPTVIVTEDPKFKTMCEEIFGPVMTIYVYPENDYEKTLKLLDETSEYALTGAIFAVERYAIDTAFKMLENAAGNFYINDKPTGAVVGQQPFGGARKSGTNDKAGSYMNLLRFVSARTIKETFVPATDYKYEFLG